MIPMSQIAWSVPVVVVRRWELEATQRLLGDTIGIADPQWRGPSLLPGWSRAHVATHVARNADGLRSLTVAAEEGRPAIMYASDEERFAAIERGAERTGLELQIDLDTSAGALTTSWDRVTDWSLRVPLFGREVPLSALPLVRLHEVVLHHIDLDCGFSAGQVDPEPARWLLEWALDRLGEQVGLPSLRLQSASGLAGTLGAGEPERTVRGSDARLWAWVTGRATADTVNGADGIELPMMS